MLPPLLVPTRLAFLRRPLLKSTFLSQGDEELFELTQLNPTLLSEMSTKTRFLFLEVYLEDLQDVYSEVMETLDADKVSRTFNCAARAVREVAIGT